MKTPVRFQAGHRWTGIADPSSPLWNPPAPAVSGDGERLAIDRVLAGRSPDYVRAVYAAVEMQRVSDLLMAEAEKFVGQGNITQAAPATPVAGSNPGGPGINVVPKGKRG